MLPNAVSQDFVANTHTYRSSAVQFSRNGSIVFTCTRSWNNTEATGRAAAYRMESPDKLPATQTLTYYEAPLSLGSAGGLRVAFRHNEANAKSDIITYYTYFSDTQVGCMYV